MVGFLRVHAEEEVKCVDRHRPLGAFDLDPQTLEAPRSDTPTGSSRVTKPDISGNNYSKLPNNTSVGGTSSSCAVRQDSCSPPLPPFSSRTPEVATRTTHPLTYPAGYDRRYPTGPTVIRIVR